jgi:hypothetical protein
MSVARWIVAGEAAVARIHLRKISRKLDRRSDERWRQVVDGFAGLDAS